MNCSSLAADVSLCCAVWLASRVETELPHRLVDNCLKAKSNVSLAWDGQVSVLSMVRGEFGRKEEREVLSGVFPEHAANGANLEPVLAQVRPKCTAVVVCSLEQPEDSGRERPGASGGGAKEMRTGSRKLMSVDAGCEYHRAGDAVPRDPELVEAPWAPSSARSPSSVRGGGGMMSKCGTAWAAWARLGTCDAAVGDSDSTGILHNTGLLRVFSVCEPASMRVCGAASGEERAWWVSGVGGFLQ